MKKAAVVGGNSGIGLALTIFLLEKGYDFVSIIGRDAPNEKDIPTKYRNDFFCKSKFYKVNFVNEDYEAFDNVDDIETLIITCGFGRVAPFESLTDDEITNLYRCNLVAITRIIKLYYDKISGVDDFYCAVMGSIAGHLASPLMSVYGAAKSGLCALIENVNSELAAQGCKNRILDVSPGALKNTNFDDGHTDVLALWELSNDILNRMYCRDTIFIPQYDIYKSVIERYRNDPKKYALESYQYKVESKRMNLKPQIVVGYLSGTFDLFHVGHLNLLRQAKQECDYLIVGVHYSGSWKGKETFIPYEERVEILKSVRYVDRVVLAPDEDSDAWDKYHFDCLFVGSDYKGTERFDRYEKFFLPKGVRITYFPYTVGTSSTQLREHISNERKELK